LAQVRENAEGFASGNKRIYFGRKNHVLHILMIKQTKSLQTEQVSKKRSFYVKFGRWDSVLDDFLWYT